MKDALMDLVREDATRTPRDPSLDDLTQEERDAIVPAREVDQPPDPPEMPKAPSPESAVTMDPVIVEDRREPTLKKDLQALDEAAAREERATKPTTLDRILNHPLLSFLGGMNAEARAAMARQRLRIMDVERMLLISIELAETEAEKAELRSYLWELRKMRQ